jgi:hypothetical protein
MATNIPPESTSLAEIAGVIGGSEVVSDTVLRTGEFSRIVVLSGTQFTTLTGNHAGFSGVTYPAGLNLSGEFTEVQLASGSILLFNSVR